MLKVEEVEERELAKHVKASAKSLFGPKATGAKNVQLFYSKFEPGGETYLHKHDVESGHFIISGVIIFITEEAEYRCGPSTAIFVPPGVKHRFKNTGTDTVHMVSIFAPPEKLYEEE